jgi:hypothetical protein
VRTPTLLRAAGVGLAAAGIALSTLVPLSAAVAAPSSTPSGLVITEWMYKAKLSSGAGEYAEFTNLSTSTIDLTGWYYDDDHRAASTKVSLSSLGSIAPGESFLLVDEDPATFRTNWSLDASVKVLQQTENLGNGDEINIWDASDVLQDRLSYTGDAATNPITSGTSAWVQQSQLDAGFMATNAKGTATVNATGAKVSVVGDASGAWTGVDGSIGSPGHTQFAPGTTLGGVGLGTGGATGPTVPCDTEAPSGTGAAIAGGVAWPGGQNPTTADTQCQFVTINSGQDISGLVFDPSNAGVVYAAKNKSHIYKLVKSNGQWLNATTGGWSNGKEIAFKDGTGQPDDEAITIGGDGAIYTTTERNNADKNVARDTVLRFDPAATTTTLTATQEWTFSVAELGLTASSADANLGFEGITYVPDTALTAGGFVDQTKGHVYTPSEYAGHGNGLYFVAVEKTAHILAYALNSDGTKAQVADIATGMPAIAEVQWDPDTKALWAIADNTSSGSTEVMRLHGGAFTMDRVFNRPTGLPNYNLEGFAIAPSSTCVNGQKEVLRSDDGNNGGHSIWSGTIDCDLGLDAAITASASDVTAGGTVSISATGLTPGNTYAVVLHSDPAVIGTGTAAGDGTLKLSVTIPAGTTPGAHTLGIANTADPAYLFTTSALSVTALALAATGVEAAPLAVAGGILALLGVGIALGSVLVGRRRRSA